MQNLYITMQSVASPRTPHLSMMPIAYQSAKFDEEAHNGLVSIAFISLFPYMSIVTLTFDLQNQ